MHFECILPVQYYFMLCTHSDMGKWWNDANFADLILSTSRCSIAAIILILNISAHVKLY